MKIKEAIIIAGGLGTRLQNILKDVPKPMADINGTPFLEYLIDHAIVNGVEKLVLSIGYKAEIIQSYFDKHPIKAHLKYSVENEPLGTGGGIKKALNLIEDPDALILNGDTFFDIDIQSLYKSHIFNRAQLTMALRKMSDCSRYEKVIIAADNGVTGFDSSRSGGPGLINGGAYIINKHTLNNMPQKFSFETDFIAKYFNELKLYGYPFDNYFIDIGIPEDYEKAKKELKKS